VNKRCSGDIKLLWGYLWELGWMVWRCEFFDCKHPTKAVEMRETGGNNSNCMVKIRIRYYYQIQSALLY